MFVLEHTMGANIQVCLWEGTHLESTQGTEELLSCCGKLLSSVVYLLVCLLEKEPEGGTSTAHSWNPALPFRKQRTDTVQV